GEPRHALRKVAEVDQHAPLADTRQRDDLAMCEACADLARLHELRVRARNISRSEQSHHRQSVLEVTLLNAVDARVLEQTCGALDPSLAPTEVAFETETLREARTEVRGAVDRALTDACLMGAHPVGEAFLVVAGEVRGGAEPVEVVDVELVDRDAGEQAEAVAPAALVACHPRVVDDAHGSAILPVDE